MKKGQIVKVIDGSYNKTIIDGKFKYEYGLALKKTRYEVIETNIKISGDNSIPTILETQTLDIMLKSLDEDKFVFTLASLCVLVHTCKTCPNCGENIK